MTYSFHFYQVHFLAVLSAALVVMGGLLPLWIVSAPKTCAEREVWRLRLLSLPVLWTAVGLLYIYSCLEPVISTGKEELFIRPVFWTTMFFVVFCGTMGLTLLFRPDLVKSGYNASMKAKLGSALGQVIVWSVVAEACKLAGEAVRPEALGNPLTIVTAILSGGVQAPLFIYLVMKLQGASVPLQIPQIGDQPALTIVIRQPAAQSGS